MTAAGVPRATCGNDAVLSFDDLARLFLPDTPLLEIVLRGTVTYLSLFAILRVVDQRTAGTVGITNLLVIVLIADAAQNAMAGEYTSITDGILLVATIVAWSYVLDWLGFRYPRIGRVVHPPPRSLVEDGKPVAANLRRELITREELMTQLRLQGIEDLADVRRAAMEGNGEVSVLKREGEPEPHKPKGVVR